MTSFMNILVRVQANRALATLAQVRGGIHGVDEGMARAGRRELIGQRHIGALARYGNQLQWTGRMLQYNFSLPIAAAGIAATKFALDQEKAFVHVAKVYGDTAAATEQFRKEMGLAQGAAEDLANSYRTEELEALDRAFTALSNHFGVQKKEVNEIAGAWAAAGASGRDLAESTRATMEAMIIGDMDAATATKALISIQAQYNLSTQELSQTLAHFNSIENQTGASMSDLITGMEKAAGVARSAGIETSQLAAYMAALVPATGSASTAGNALKTIISRLVAPTKESAQVMNAMGLEVDKFAWNASTGTERIQAMAERFQELSKAEQNAAASVIASRWQVNRFDVLMREVINTQGHYANALRASRDDLESFTRMQEELNTVLESNPRRLQRMMVILQNASVEIIQPLIPHIIYLAQTVAQAAQSFANLGPETQKLVLFLVLLLAAVGPVVRYFGALTTLFSVVGKTAQIGAHGVSALGRALLALTFMPLLKGLSIFAAWLGGTSGLIAAQGSVIKTIYYGFLAFGARWNVALVAIFKLGWIKAVATTVKGWAANLVAFKVGAALQLINLKLFWTRFMTLWTTATVMAGGRWAGFMLLLLTLSRRGLAAIAATFVRGLLITKAIGWIGAGVVASWRLTMQTLIVASVGTTRILKAIWGAHYVATLGIWAKLKASAQVIFVAMRTSIAAIWGSMHLTMLVMAKGMRTGVLAIYASMSKGIKTLVLKTAAFMFGPWGLAIAAVLGILYTFRDQIAQVWNNISSNMADAGWSITGIFTSIGDSIMGVFRSLPEGVQNAMVAVVTVVRDAALAVYEWFSYINPFARHSPSLVENVTNGMAEVNRQFASMSKIKGYVNSAYAEIKRFGALTAKLGVSATAAQQAQDRATLKKAGAGQALGSYTKLIGILNKLTPVLTRLEGKMNDQQRVVDRWQQKVDEANRKLDVQRMKLDQLQSVLDKYQDKVDEAEDALSRFARTPIEGMREMEEQIFANQMAQLKLRDEMMRFEDVYGTFDQLKAKIDAINGAQELLRGTQSELRAAGAGSEILSQYDQELAKLDQQKDSYKDAADKLADMQKALDALQRQAERLDLTKALKFDEMLHQIEMAANRMQELPFEEIMSGIAGANAQIDKYGPKVDAASAAVAKQQAVVDKLSAARDKLQTRLDAEQAVLDRIKAKYDEVNDAVQAINQSMQDVISSADRLERATGGKGRKGAKGGSEYISPGLQNFLNAGDAGFPDPGGKGIPPRKDWTSQAADIDAFTDELSGKTADMFASLNPFAPLKGKAKEVWDWITQKASGAASAVGRVFSGAFEGVNIGGGGDFFGKLEGIGERVTEIIRDVAQVFKWAWDLLGPEIIKIGKGIWDGLKGIWEQVGPELEKFGPVLANVGDALSNVWTVVKPIFAVMVGALLVIGKVLLSVFGETIGPVLKNFGEILAGVARVTRGIFEVIIGILSGDWKMAWDGVVSIVSGTFKAIWGVIKGAVNLVLKPIKGLVKGIWGFFVWLKDILVDHSVVPDMVDAIVFWFKKLVSLARWVWSNVLLPIVRFFGKALPLIVGALTLWWAGIKVAWSALTAAGEWIWNNVLKPVWNSFVWVWDKIKPFLKNWWAGVKRVWSGLKTAGKWVWENVLKPIWTGFKIIWSKHIKPSIEEWWPRIKRAWNALKALGKWVWDNVLLPAYNKVKDIWTNRVAPELRKWRSRFENAWSKLKGMGTWVKREVMDPVFSKIKAGWERIRDFMKDNKDMLFDGAKGLVNGIIRAVNTVINGLNKVSDVLPKIEWHIDPIQKLASGGNIPRRRVGSGFMTSGARAIVGEGKANHPEFVIPTDPTHRKRATALLGMAAKKLGVHGGHGGAVANSTHTYGGVPAYDIGGWIEDKWKGIKGQAKKQLGKLGRGAIKGIMNPVLSLAQKAVNATPWKPIRVPPTYAFSKIRKWADTINKVTDAGSKKASTPKGGSVSVPDPANPSGRTTWKGGTFTNKFVAHLKKAEELAGRSIHVMQGGFRPATSYSGTSHQGDAIDLQTGNSLIKALRQVGIAAGDRTGLGSWAPHTHAVPGPGAGYAGGSAIWQFQDYLAKGGMNQPYNSTWGLANGAIVKARRGGIRARIGEGLNDEAIVPLPRDYRTSLLGKGSDSGKKEFHFHGDLSFPNITDPADAQTFISNLEALAK